MKRKILSLLMVFVLLCGMLPAALAEGDGWSGGTAQDTSCTHSKYTETITTPATCQSTGVKTLTCDSCGATKTETIEKDDKAHTFSEWVITEATCKDEGKRERNCTVQGCSKRESESIPVTNEHKVTPSSYKQDSATQHIYTCSVCSKEIKENHDTTSGTCSKCGYVVSSTTPEDSTVSTVRIDDGNITLSYNGTKTLSYTAKNAAGKTVTPKSVSWESSNEKIATVSTSGKVSAVNYGEAKITVTADGKTDYIWVTVEKSSDISISATVYNSNTGYALGDKDDAGNKSVVDKITAELSSKEYIDYVQFDSVSEKNKGSLSCRTKDRLDEDELAEVEFEPDEDYTGSVSFNFTLKTNRDTYDGVLTFNVKKGTASNAKGDINYTGTRGGTVYFDSRDFEDYFEDEYPRGELEYVTFSRASNGTVYYDGKKISTSDEFYANPGKRDKDLDEVYYEPSSDTYTGTATVSFTAYGENSSGTSKSTSGVVSIVYSSANAKDISYQATNGSVRLNADDFVSTYKKATGVTSSNPTMYIRFTKLPSKGNLYVGYTANGGGSKVSTSTYYSSKSSASSYIGDITYVPSAAGGTETVEYTAYSTDASSGLKYTGKIVFTANAAVSNRPVNIYYNCTGGSVKFASADFSGSSESMALIDYLTFGTPSNGALYTNYANGSGDKVSAGNLFAYYSLPSMGYQRIDAVTYVPPMGWSGTASVPFTAYLVGGGTITGTVSISVTATSSTSLRDVKTTDWYATYVTDLMAAGVLTGYEDNTFRSTNNVTYGEILKLVMLSTGYSEQSKTGTHWASGYVDRALSDGIISERVNPDAYADRAAVADIAAKAMKLAPVTGGTSPFTDSANGYARALYNAGIITGYEENGRTYYRGANRIERSHIAAIIWRIMNYDGKTVTPPTNPSQPTTPSRPDTEAPDWLQS